MTVTLKDVALMSGVTAGTVSRVLNNKIDMPILPETVLRIKEAARELEYIPNTVARSLATGRTHTIGMFSNEITDPHFAQLLEAAEARADALGYHLTVSGTLESVSRRKRVDGVLVLGSAADPQFARISEHLPRVFVYNTSEVCANKVAWSDQEGIESAVKYLLDLGHTRIAGLFCYGLQSRPLHSKVLGFRAAVAGRGIDTWECWQTWPTNELGMAAHCHNGYLSTKQLIQEGADFTAIVARNDLLALGALRALREAGMSVPDRVSVIGYTDSIHAACADPALTSVRTPIADAGRIAIERLIRAIERREARFDGIMLPTTLEIRQSCAPFTPSG